MVDGEGMAVMAVRECGVPMLTDDEIVAASARLESTWRTPLPTVNLDAPDGALAAFVRGSRALYVRGLLDMDSNTLDGALLDHLTVLCSKPIRLAAFVADPVGEPLAGAPLQYFFSEPGDDLWMCDAVSAGGVHTFGTDSGQDVRTDAHRAIENVLQNGVRGLDPSRAVLTLISEGRAGEVRQVNVAEGAMRASITSNGTLEDVALDKDVPDVALRWLLAD